MDISRSGCAGGSFYPPPLHPPLRPPACVLPFHPNRMLSHFLEPFSLPSKPMPELKTLFNWSKPLIWLVWLCLPHRMFHRCFTTAKTGRMQRAVGTRGRGTAGITERRNHGFEKIRGSYVEQSQMQLVLNS